LAGVPALVVVAPPPAEGRSHDLRRRGKVPRGKKGAGEEK
jgi:hypothetical protein